MIYRRDVRKSSRKNIFNFELGGGLGVVVGLVDHYVCPFRGLRFHIDQDNRKEKCSVEIREGTCKSG